MTTSQDPYDVLGLPRTASFVEVRAKYFQLAKKHHPDKLTGLSPEEKRTNEEYFQKVSVAYSQIERNTNGTGGSGIGGKQDPEHWRNIWANVEQMFQRPDVWECMRKVFKDTISDVVTKVREQKEAQNRIHRMKVPVTLEELELGKEKKVQLFLQNVTEPIRTVLDCSLYPQECVITKTMPNDEKHQIHLSYVIEEHPTFHLDDVLGTNDLYTEEEVTWYDYIFGKSIDIQHLNGEKIHTSLYPFADTTYPVCIPGKGLAGRGDLYIVLKLVFPSHDKWLVCGKDEQENFANILNALCHTRSDVPKPKTI